MIHWRSFFGFIYILFSLNGFAQEEVEYCKDPFGSISVKEKKAVFKKVTRKEGSIKIVDVIALKNDELVNHKEYSYESMETYGFPVGKWITCDKDGDNKKWINFDNVRYLSKEELKKNVKRSNVQPGTLVAGHFGESPEDLYMFLGQEIRYPKESKFLGVQGKVYLSFTVTTEGRTKDFAIVRGADPLLDAEAYRVLSSIEVWNVSTVDGKAEETTFMMPVQFNLK